MNKVNAGLVVSTLLSITFSSFASNNYFTCNTAKGRLSLEIDENHLVYEMQSQGVPLFTFSSKAPKYSEFSYNHYSRFQTDYLNVSFNNRVFKYTVFSNYEDGNSAKGVMVTNLKTKKDYTYRCEGEGIDKLSDLVSKLQCEKDSAFGCS